MAVCPVLWWWRRWLVSAIGGPRTPVGTSWSQHKLVRPFSSSPATTVNTKGRWPLTVLSEIVYPLPFLWGLWVGTAFPLLGVFIPHNLWLSKKELLFKKRAPCAWQPLTLLGNPAGYQEASAAAVEKTLRLGSLMGANQIVWHSPACPKGKQAKNLNQ